MAGKQAKILSKDQLSDLLLYASCTRHPDRNRLIALLSAKAGLRAGEIAKLTWDMVLEPGGGVGSAIELRDHAANMQVRAADTAGGHLHTNFSRTRLPVGELCPFERRRELLQQHGLHGVLRFRG
jgi:integrase